MKQWLSIYQTTGSKRREIDKRLLMAAPVPAWRVLRAWWVRTRAEPCGLIGGDGTGKGQTAREVRELGDLQRVVLSLQLSMGQWEAIGSLGMKKEPPKRVSEQFPDLTQARNRWRPHWCTQKASLDTRLSGGYSEFYCLGIGEYQPENKWYLVLPNKA